MAGRRESRRGADGALRAATFGQVQTLRDAEARFKRAEYALSRVKNSDSAASADAVANEYVAAKSEVELARAAVGLPIPLPPASGSAAPKLSQYALSRCLPQPDTAPATLTPTALGALVARVFPFVLPGDLTLARVIVRTLAALADGYRFGIYAADGASKWTSGPVTTVNGFTVIVVNPTVALAAGQYFFAVTNNAKVSASAALQVSAPLAQAVLPRWGTVPVVGGAMPAQIDPAAITEAVGGFPVYVTLSEWTT